MFLLPTDSQIGADLSVVSILTFFVASETIFNRNHPNTVCIVYLSCQCIEIMVLGQVGLDNRPKNIN
jgi:hypothetical protein